MNNKLKKLLVATLATTSTFSGFNASAFTDSLYVSGGDATLTSPYGAGQNLFALSTGAEQVDGVLLAENTYQLVLNGANNATVDTSGMPFFNGLDLHGFGGRTVTINAALPDGFAIQNTQLELAPGGAAAAINAGADGDAATVSLAFGAGAGPYQLVLPASSFSQFVAGVNFGNQAVGYNASITGGYADQASANAADAPITTSFTNGANSVVHVNLTDNDKWIALNNDASKVALQIDVGNVDYLESSKRNVTIAANTSINVVGTLTGTVDGVAVGNSGTLRIAGGGEITDAVGANVPVENLVFTGATGKIGTLGKTVNANTINLADAGTLVANGEVTSANGLVFNVAGAAFQYGAAQNLLKVAFGEGVNGSQVTQVINGADMGSGAQDVTTALKFDTDHLFTVAAGKQFLQAVTTKTDGEGKITYADVANITKNIGTKDLSLGAITLTGAGNKIADGVSVYGGVTFAAAADSDLAIGSGATVSNLTAVAAVNTVTTAGSINVGDINFTAALATSSVQLNGATIFGASFKGNGADARVVLNAGTYDLKDVAGVFELSDGVDIKTGAVINTNGNAISINGATLTIASGATLNASLTAGGLILDTNISANNPVINVDYSSAALPNSYAAMVAPRTIAGAIQINAGAAPGAAGFDAVAAEAMADTLRLKGNRLAQYTAQFNNGTNVTDVITGYTLADFDQHFSVGDKTADWGAEAYSVVNAYANASDVSDLDKLVAPSHTVDSSRATSNSAVDVATRALDSFGSDVAISAGESANNVGMFVTPFMASGKTKSDGNIAGNSFRMNGASVGMTVDLNDDSTRLGFALTFANSKAKMKDAKAGDSSKGQTTAVTAFGEYEFANNLTFQGIATLGSVSTKAKETFTLGQYSGKYQSTFYSLLGKVGYNISVNPEMSMMPYTTVRYDSYRDPAYSLSLNGNKVKYSSSNTNKTAAMVGVKFSGDMKYDETKLAPFADLSFGCDFGKANFKTIDLGNLTPNSQNSDNNRTLMSARLGVEATMESGFSATLAGGSDRIGKKTTVYSGSLKLAYKF